MPVKKPTMVPLRLWGREHTRDANRILQRWQSASLDSALQSIVEDSNGRQFVLCVLLDQDYAGWVLLTLDRDIAGYGELARLEQHYQIQYAHIHPDFQRKNLYTTVLKKLREILGPLRSDWSLTEGAVKTWQKLGAEYVSAPEGEDYYQFNPARQVSRKSSSWTGWALALGGALAVAFCARRQKPAAS